MAALKVGRAVVQFPVVDEVVILEVQRLRPGVVPQDLVALGEPLLQSYLQGVVVAVGIVAEVAESLVPAE